jgi:hypothetical protein
MKGVNAKLYPRLKDSSFRLIVRIQILGCLRSVITEDKSWMYDYNLQTKTQTCHWNTTKSRPAKEARQSKCECEKYVFRFIPYSRN